jgi:hypothetical protein
MSWLISSPEPKYLHSRARLVDRLFGIEYTKFEMRQIQEFDAARKKQEVDLTGFVSWIDKKQFLFLPTRTTNCIYIICQTREGVNFPSNNQYVTIKGKIQPTLDKKSHSIYKTLIAETITPTKEDFGKIDPDISQKDFEQTLFDGWINIDPITQNLIAQNYVSSPTTSERAGGITLSLFNPPRNQRVVNSLHADIRRLIPPEIYGTRDPVFDVHELDRKHSLPSFNWSERIDDVDNPSSILPLLERMPHAHEEYSISLLSRGSAPRSLDSIGIVKSDYPIVLEDHMERKRNSSYTSPEITKFLIAAQMNSPSVEPDFMEKSIQYARDEIEKLAREREDLAMTLGHNQFLDLGINGKPLSIVNLAISRVRSLIDHTMVLEDTKKTTDDYLDNLKHVSHVWFDELAISKIHPLATLGSEEHRILALLHNKGPHSIQDTSNTLKLDYHDCAKVFRSLLYKHAIFEHSDGKYDAV